jgi:hypothetical protein
MPYPGANSEFGLPADESESDDHSSATGYTPPVPIKSPEIAARENTHVRYSRLLVLFVLACSALGVGYLTYSFVTNEEEEDFKLQVR